MKSHNRRKKYLLNPKFQVTLIAYFFAMSLLILSIFYFSISYFFMKFHEVGVMNEIPQDHIFFRFLSEQRYTMDWIFVATSFTCFVILFLGGLILSHKIAGPIYRLGKYVEDLKAGKNPGIPKFRQNDFFPELQQYVEDLHANYQDKKDHKTRDAA